MKIEIDKIVRNNTGMEGYIRVPSVVVSRGLNRNSTVMVTNLETGLHVHAKVRAHNIAGANTAILDYDTGLALGLNMRETFSNKEHGMGVNLVITRPSIIRHQIEIFKNGDRLTRSASVLAYLGAIQVVSDTVTFCVKLANKWLPILAGMLS